MSEKNEKEEKSKKTMTISELPGIGPASAEKLASAGYKTLESIAVASPMELVEAAGIGELTAGKAINAARESLEMGYETADKIMERRKNIGKISTGSKELDALLGGGIETQGITEAYGQFGSGKSQLCFQASVMVQLPKEKGGLAGNALYVDTEHSLPYSEKVLVVENRIYKFRKIGELVEEAIKSNAVEINGSLSSADNEKNIMAVSFDPEDYKIRKFRITGFIKHPAKKIYEVKLKSGRSVKVTEYHNFFTMDETCELSPIATKQLAAGSYIAVPSRLPETAEQFEFDLSEVLQHSKENFYVRGGIEFKEDLRALSKELRDVAGINNFRREEANNWIRRSLLPLVVFNSIKQKLKTDVRALRIGGWSRKGNLPLIIEADKKFIRFLASYVAEGCTTAVNNCIRVTTTSKHIADYVYDFGKALGLKVGKASNNPDYIITSKTLVEVMNVLGVGHNAYQKAVPAFVLGMPDELKTDFLDTYVFCDGNINSRGQTYCETVSDSLADFNLYLTASLGIPAGNNIVTRQKSGGIERLLKTFSVHWAPNKLREAHMNHIPNSDCILGRTIKRVRSANNLTMMAVCNAAGLKSESLLWQIESGNSEMVTRKKLLKIMNAINKLSGKENFHNLNKLLSGEVWFDRVKEIKEAGFEPTYDIEVMPDGKPVQNFIGGRGGIILHNTFRPERIMQMAKNKGLDPEKVLKNIFVARAYNADHQMLLIEKASEIIKEKNIKLVIVDSLTAQFRAEYIGRGKLADRQQKLNKHMHALQKLAEMNNLIVLVTNQVMSRPDILFGDPTAPIGGNIVGHTAMYRLYFRKSKGEKRIARLVDSPGLPDGEAIFAVTEKGIEDAKLEKE